MNYNILIQNNNTLSPTTATYPIILIQEKISLIIFITLLFVIGFIIIFCFSKYICKKLYDSREHKVSEKLLQTMTESYDGTLHYG